MQILIIILVVAIVFAVPGAWIVMLALGNFGFSQFGLIDCIPAGIILGMVASSSSN